MKNIVNNWYNIFVYIAVALLLVVAFAITDPLQKVLLSSSAILFLHFYEEFGWIGGFPYMGMKVLMGSDETDSIKWDCNNLNSMFGNWLCIILLYIHPIFLPNVKCMILAAMFLSVAELFMHLILFNIKGKTIYNPGAISAIFDLTPIAIYFFAIMFNPSLYAWYDYILALVWFAVIFWFCFRSPLYWNLGKKEGYPLTDQSAYGIQKNDKEKKLS